jgi:hypothetical protein
MEQNCSESLSHLATQYIILLLRDLSIHFRVYSIPPLAPILSQMNPVYTLIPYSLYHQFRFIYSG